MTEPRTFTEQERDDALRQMAKRELRRRLRALRASLPARGVARRSAAISERLVALAVVAAAPRIALFWPIEGRNEVDLRPLIEQLLADGKQVALPVAAEDSVGLRWLTDVSTMAPGPMGFDEPPVSGGAAEVDVLIAPALAVDARGHRLGYGRGYYDRLLASLPGLTTVAVAYDFQLIGEVPTTSHDVALGWVVTDRRAFRAGTEVGEAALEPSGDGTARGPSGDGTARGPSGDGATGESSGDGATREPRGDRATVVVPPEPAPRAGVKVVARPGRRVG